MTLVPARSLSGVGAAAWVSTRWGDRARGRSRSVFAAVDLGTNNCRMLIARPDGNAFRVIDSFSRTTRLGEGLVGSGELGEPAMKRSLEALKRCADKMTRRGVTAARHVATEACRRARNCDEFLARVLAETGIRLEIISTAEEARLAVCGCSALLDRSVPHALVFDIGGGSTEVMSVRVEGTSAAVEGFVSLPLGVLTAAEQCGGSGGGDDAYEAMVGRVRRMLGAFADRHGLARRIADGEVQMLGTSGTVTTLAAIHLGLSRYERRAVDGLALPFGAVLDIIRRLVAMTPRQRSEHPCIGADRSELVVAGCAILDGICRMWPVDKLRVADRGLREGMLLELLGQDPRGVGAGA
ncbi:MAG: Ppx/GppA family phosphatase [Alphaproteobacteria bacterium]